MLHQNKIRSAVPVYRKLEIINFYQWRLATLNKAHCVAKLIKTILKMSAELTYRIWITLYKKVHIFAIFFSNIHMLHYSFNALFFS